MGADVVFIASEIFPFSKTGGLGDVLGALPLALHNKGIKTAVITPFYGRLGTAEYDIRLAWSDLQVGYPWAPITADVYQADYKGMPVYFIHRSEYYDRRFYYCNHKGDFFDNAERFIFFNRAAQILMERFDTAPQIIHAHDWQAALSPAYLHYNRMSNPFWEDTRSVFTIHNLAFQGRFASRLFENCGLPPSAWSMHGVEFYGDFNFMKAGISYADKITTVSPNYSKEILTRQFGCDLHNVLMGRKDRLNGILNGADYEIWNPEDNKYLPKTYNSTNVRGKRACKSSLIDELGLDPSLKKRPMLGFIGRLREQKGVNMLIDIIPQLMEKNVGLVILGEGNLEREATLLNYMESYPKNMCTIVDYTEELAHKIQAASDIFLMPSTYEPCGLTQLYALRFGTVPVASAVGGLHDTIMSWPHPHATGFTFENINSGAFIDSITDAIDVWENNPREFRRIVGRAMGKKFSWDSSANEYAALYKELGLRM